MKETKKFQWVMDLCKELGVPWYVWVIRRCGLEFCCEFGGMGWKSGIVLRKGDFSMRKTKAQVKMLTTKIESYIRNAK